MKKLHPPYCEETLRQLWADGKTHREIAAALGCTELYIRVLKRRHNLPARPVVVIGKETPDPTPDEIAERAAECRQRHFNAMRYETTHAAQRRLRRLDSQRFPAIRVYGRGDFPRSLE